MWPAASPDGTPVTPALSSYPNALSISAVST
jgi:hypothetical protein